MLEEISRARMTTMGESNGARIYTDKVLINHRKKLRF
jgi:hypothetical protein